MLKSQNTMLDNTSVCLFLSSMLVLSCQKKIFLSSFSFRSAPEAMTGTTEMKVKAARRSDVTCECWLHCGQMLVGGEVEAASLMERWWTEDKNSNYTKKAWYDKVLRGFMFAPLDFM